MQHPTIRQYVGLFNDTGALWENADRAVSGLLMHGNKEHARRLAEAETYGHTGSWEEIRASYPLRLLHAKYLTGEAVEFLAHGFGGWISHAGIQHVAEP